MSVVYTTKRMAKRQSNLPVAWFLPSKKIASKKVVRSTGRDREGQSELDVSEQRDYNMFVLGDNAGTAASTLSESPTSTSTLKCNEVVHP